MARWLGRRTRRNAADDGGPLDARLQAIVDARNGLVITSRQAAMANSVVNRARDITCGVLAALELTRQRSRAGAPLEDLGPGWLRRPDPGHTGAWFKAWVTDDLFFYGYAYCRVTSRDFEGQVNALQWMPFTQVLPAPDPHVVPLLFPDGRMVAQPGQAVVWYPPGATSVAVPAGDLVIFESPLSAVLGAGSAVLGTSASLDAAAARFADVTVPAGWLKQTDGEDLSADELAERAARFEANRRVHAIGAVNRYMDYQESSMDPSRLQLVEGRSYQDVAAARVCNVPAFIVNTAVPGDSMTYKTALTARLDMVDFSLQPYVSCWEQTLSAENVTPRGTTVVMDLAPFLRTAELAGMTGAATGPPAGTEQPSSANGSSRNGAHP